MMLDAMKSTSPLLLHVLLCIALPACGDDTSDPPVAVDAAAPDAAIDAGPVVPDAGPDAGPDAAVIHTYEGDIQPIWLNRCTPCHVGDSEDLQPSPLLETGHEALVDQPSGQVTSFDLIEPGMPEASYLWLKINNQHSALSTTNAMPPPVLGGTFEPIPASERERIRAWIAAGAGATW
jgi:hypothetical protein